MIRPVAPRRPLLPFLLRRVSASRINKGLLARAAGFPAYSVFYTVLRSEKVIATPLTVERLERVADLVGFPRDEIFLDRGPVENALAQPERQKHLRAVAR